MLPRSDSTLVCQLLTTSVSIDLFVEKIVKLRDTHDSISVHRGAIVRLESHREGKFTFLVTLTVDSLNLCL